MKQAHIDHGRSFDWEKASGAYAEYRDIYPPAFYEHLLARGVCGKGQNVLDLGTGTGVLPRALYPYGAKWTGCGMQRSDAKQPASTLPYFRLTYKEAYLTPVEFTRESWHGRLTACRGTAASMTLETLAAWEEAHKKLTATFPERFVIPHWVTLAELTKK